MKKINEENAVDTLLGNEIAQEVLIELGLQSSSPEDQARVLAILGRNVLNRILFETLNLLPIEDHAEFKKLFDEQDIDALQNFVDSRIPDFVAFVKSEATKEYEATKTRIYELAQGV